jgi:thiamine-phosphate pyrophosphorylase
MDEKLVAWARSVKSRRVCLGLPSRSRLPALWLFTDARRLADPARSAARLPRGLCGVVLRQDGDAARAVLGRALARICRARQLVLVVAGDWRLAAALRAGLHLRGGRRPPVRLRGPVTSSAHNATQLIRAKRAGSRLVFVSPVFKTESHAGAQALGPHRWGLLARRAGPSDAMGLAALGGIDGARIRQLPRRRCIAAGAIGALA